MPSKYTKEQLLAAIDLARDVYDGEVEWLSKKGLVDVFLDRSVKAENEVCVIVIIKRRLNAVVDANESPVCDALEVNGTKKI